MSMTIYVSFSNLNVSGSLKHAIISLMGTSHEIVFVNLIFYQSIEFV
jgi:hypothetical protein